MQLVHWGPDLAFYDHLLAEMPHRQPAGFISTGKENRDVETLLKAFGQTEEQLDVYISVSCGNINYKKILDRCPVSEAVRIHYTDGVIPLKAFGQTEEQLDVYISVSCGNINYKKILDRCPVSEAVRIHYTDGVIPYELGKLVAQKSCIVICCLDFPYTVGLTTLVEAFALGMPVICSRNPNFEIDIDKEEIGITVPYGDVQGWVDAIRYISTHPEEARRMGQNARRLAEERFNLEIITVPYGDVQGWVDAIRYISTHPEEARRMGQNARRLAEERFNLEIFSREIAESLLDVSRISSKNRNFA